jgi:hypothetical protein
LFTVEIFKLGILSNRTFSENKFEQETNNIEFDQEQIFNIKNILNILKF